MTTTITTAAALPACTDRDLEQVREIESILASCEQVNIPTEHWLHAGMYARTCRIPAGAVISGALIARPTVVIISGHCVLNAGGAVREVNGYECLRGAAGRKQIIRAITDTSVTLVMRSSASSLEAAEQELTPEADKLLSRRQS